MFARTARRSLTLGLSLLLGLVAAWAVPGISFAGRGPRLNQVLSLSDRAKAKLPPRTKQRAIQRYGLKPMALRRSFIKKHNTHYKYQIPMERAPHQVLNQKKSGRCWAFAMDRVLESKVAKKGKAPTEISKSFINYHALRTKSLALLVTAAKMGQRQPAKLSGMLSEGGTQSRALDITMKYGVVPESKMPSTADGANSGVFLNQLQILIVKAQRSFGQIKGGPEANPKRQKVFNTYARQAQRLLDTTVGKPPRKFKVDGKFYTPKTYAQNYLGLNKGDLDYVVLSHDPTHAFNRRYQEKGVGMKPFEGYNVSMKTMQQAMKKTIRGGESIYFATNVSANNPYRVGDGPHDPKEARGVLSLRAFNYDALIPSTKISKRDRIRTGISPTNHAMTITGYDPGKKRGSVLKWKVDNSWGTAVGDKGHFHMYDDFFRQYGTKVLVPRSSVSKSVLAKIEGAPLVGANKKK